ncbi:MAG TPA: PAS domain S-box protein [Candidatus Limnocylindrales bacterium]|nr:PAS domain S-box protein [Candidatus Limnocylindrales bacterium]
MSESHSDLTDDTSGAMRGTTATERRAGDPNDGQPFELELLGAVHLLDQVQASVIVTDRNGRVISWNPHAELLFGWSREEALGREIGELTVFPEDASLAEEIMARLAQGQRWEGEFDARRKDGARVRVHVTDSPLQDDLGRFSGVLGVAVDVSARARAEAEKAELLARERWARAEAELLSEIAAATAGEDDLERILSATLERLARQVAFTGGSIALVEGDELVLCAAVGPFADGALGQRLPRGRGLSWRIVESREPYLTGDLSADSVHIVGGVGEDVLRSYLAVPLVWRDQAIGLLEIDSTEPDAFRPSDQALVERVAVALSGPVELARRFRREADALAEAQAAQDRLHFLAEASARLVGAVDYEATLKSIADLVVPRLADWCVVDLLDASGELQGVVISHVDPAKVEAARRYRELYPPDPDSAQGAHAVVRTGEPQLFARISEEMIDTVARDEQQARYFRELGLASAVVVPIDGQSGVVGAMTLVQAESGRHFEQADVELARELARRAAAALDTARLYRELARIKTTLDTTRDAVFMWDPETLHFFYVNQGAVDSLGYSHDELLTMSPLDLKVEFDEPRFRALIEPLVSGRTTSLTFSTTHRRKDGSRFPVEVSYQYVAPAGEPPRMVGIVRDITDRVEARARLQRLAQSERALSAELKAIIRAMGEGVLVFAADGRLIFSNPAADAIFRDPPISRYADVAARLSEPDWLPPLDLTEGRGPIELRTSGEPERWLEISAYPVEPPRETVDDQPEAEPGRETILFMRDVTAARQARQARDAFIGVLSHELRTPVTTIYGNSKLLARSERSRSDEARRAILGDIESESERLFRLVEDLLVLARFGEEERREMGDEPLLLQRIVPAVVQSEEQRWPGTSFDVKVESGLPPARGEQTYVEQVVRNLVNNAAKYSGPGGAVRISARTAGDEIEVTVLDQGPGFPAEESTRLFELFYRSPHTATRASGAGIGLFVCKRLIEAMGGRIWARPRPKRGSEFGFALSIFNEEAP